MISGLRIRAFQGLDEVDLRLGPMNFFLGKNGAGKSSVLDALLLLCDDEPLRHDTNGGTVRQGAHDSLTEMVIGKRTFGRRQTASTAQRYINGAPVTKEVFLKGLADQFQVSREVLIASLRAGALLDMKDAALLNTLLALSGTTIDAAAIAKEVADLAEPLKRLAFPELRDLGEMRRAEKLAVSIRQDAKRDITRLEADLARLPVPDAAVLASLSTQTVADLEKRITDLNRRRDVAIRLQASAAGRSAERLQQVRDRIDEIEAMAAPGSPPSRTPAEWTAKQTDALKKSAQADALAKSLKKGLDDGRLLAEGNKTLPEDVDELAKLIEASETRIQESVSHRDAIRLDRNRIAAMIDQLKAGSGHCDTCGQTITPAIIESFQQQFKSKTEAFDQANKEQDRLREELRILTTRSEEIRQVHDRITAAAAIPAQEQKLAEATKERDSQQKEADSCARNAEASRQILAKIDVHRAAQQELVALRTQLTEMQQPVTPAEDVKDLDAALDTARAQKLANEQANRRLVVSADLSKVRVREEDADAVATACGPSGAPARLVSKAVAPFLAVANQALNELLPGFQVDLAANDGLHLLVKKPGATLSVRAVSAGERRRVLHVLQVAAALQSGAPLVAFDECELTGEDGWARLLDLAERCADQGLQVLILSANAPTLIDGAKVFRFSDGRAQEETQAAPGAAA